MPSHTGVPGNVSQKCFPHTLLWGLGIPHQTVLFSHLERVQSAWLLSLPFGLLKLFTDFSPLIWKPDTLHPGCWPGLQPGPPGSLHRRKSDVKLGYGRASRKCSLPGCLFQFFLRAYPVTWPLLNICAFICVIIWVTRLEK